MNYSTLSRLSRVLCAILPMAGMFACKGPDPKTAITDTTRRILQASDTLWETLHDTASPNDLEVSYHTPTKFQTAKGTQPTDRTYDLDGEAWLYVRNADKRPVVIHTRLLILTIQSPYARLHIDAFATSPGEQADLLEGQLKATKSYHSSTDNEPEILKSGDMVMINKDIDLMEKETLDSTERKAVEKKFPKPDDTTPRN